MARGSGGAGWSDRTMTLGASARRSASSHAAKVSAASADRPQAGEIFRVRRALGAWGVVGGQQVDHLAAQQRGLAQRRAQGVAGGGAADRQPAAMQRQAVHRRRHAVLARAEAEAAAAIGIVAGGAGGSRCRAGRRGQHFRHRRQQRVQHAAVFAGGAGPW
jgi:hypothetical protein